MPGMIMSRMIVGWLEAVVRLDERAPIGRHADLVAEVFGDVLTKRPKAGSSSQINNRLSCIPTLCSALELSLGGTPHGSGYGEKITRGFSSDSGQSSAALADGGAKGGRL